jgi:hypothetical protein
MTDYWIVPCNISFFNLIEHFKTNNTVVWRNAFSMHKDDYAYIYLTKPYTEIRYKCIVINDSVDEMLLAENSYAIPSKKSYNYYSKKDKYIQLKLICEYKEGTFPLHLLKEHGLGQVQMQSRTGRTLQHFLTDVENQLERGDTDA